MPSAHRLDDDGFDAAWAVSNFDPGKSELQSCEDARQKTDY
jgi:hypothetical protein